MAAVLSTPPVQYSTPKLVESKTRQETPSKEGTTSSAAAAAYLSKVSSIVKNQLLSNNNDSGSSANTGTTYDKKTTNSQGLQMYDLSVFKSDPFTQGIMAATAAYIAAVNQQQIDQTFNNLNLSKIQTDLMNKFMDASQQTATKIAAQVDAYNSAQSSSNFLSTFLGYLMGAINIIVGLLTADPTFVVMGIVGIVSTATNLQAKLADAIPDDGWRALAEFGIAVGEAGLASGGNLASFLIALPQFMMMNNVLTDAFTAAGMSPEDAMYLSMALSIPLMIMGGVAASKVASEDAANWISKLASVTLGKIFSEEGLQFFQNAMKLVERGMQVSSGAMQISEAGYQKQAAAIVEEMGLTQQFYTTLQGTTNMTQQAMSTTQNGAQALNQIYATMGDSFASLGRLLQDPSTKR